LTSTKSLWSRHGKNLSRPSRINQLNQARSLTTTVLLTTFIYDNQGVKDVVLDTHQSQANRVEPSFDGTGLIPDSTITVGEESINLTSVGHRVVDATVRFSDKAGLVQSALKAFEAGDATPLAKLAPTSILFGMWDSRINSGASGVKVTRIFHSEIRAHNVIEVPAAGQYVSSVDRIEDQKTGDLSAEGLLDVPHSGLGAAQQHRHEEKGYRAFIFW